MTTGDKRIILDMICREHTECRECPMEFISSKGCPDFMICEDSEIESIYKRAFPSDQDIKSDAGKPQLTLVPRQILFDIARIREYGIKKYGEKESWKKVEIERYRDATFRHFIAYLDDPQGVDDESGLPHLSHLACNIAFLCELEKEKI